MKPIIVQKPHLAARIVTFRVGGETQRMPHASGNRGDLFATNATVVRMKGREAAFKALPARGRNAADGSLPGNPET